jgi:hypothetical protein
MHKYLLPLLLVVCFPFILKAQPKPCGNPAKMTSFCKDACIICDINGFTGINNSNVKGEGPPGFCTTTVHNAQWIAFMAGSTNLTLQVSVFNCKNGNSSGGGLEVGIYKSTDCKNFELVSNCDGDISNNTSQNFTNTKPLIIGQYYYFMMDGNGGDICNYTIKVTNGTTKVNPLTNSGVLKGNFAVCEGGKYKFENEGVLGAIDYEWTLNNVAVGKGLSVEVNLPNSGTADLCCTASNVCDKAPPSCRTITILPKKQSVLQSSICKGDCLKVADSLFCKGGNFTVKTKTKNGCDSTISVQIAEYQPATSDLNLIFCQGDTVFVAKKSYTKAGIYQDKLKTIHGCDSLLTITLNEVICKIKSKTQIKNVVCNGEKNGNIKFSVSSGTPPFTYNWQEINNPTISGNGNITTLNTFETLNNLSVGNYFITINDTFGNKNIIQELVNQPDTISINATTSAFGQYQVSCFGDKNGKINVTAKGGTTPYEYLWQNAATNNSIENLSTGLYELTVTDKAGCLAKKTFSLTSPSAITYDAVFKNPNCDGLNTGKVLISNLKGGQSPYTYLLNNQVVTDTILLKKLSEGNYELGIKDANGCVSLLKPKGTLVTPKIPIISLGETKSIKLGESVYITISSNVKMDSIIWAKIAGLSCYDCPEPLATPVWSNIYEVKVVSEDGCATKGTIQILVDKNHKIYVPNVFSPGNLDGINDGLTVFAPPSVAKIKSFSIFDRWGNLIFKNTNFLPNDPLQGWDGYYKGVIQNPSVFTWVAEIEFLDGAISFFAGDVMSVK